MRPDEDNNTPAPRSDTPYVPKRSYTHTPPSRNPDYGQQRDAAANLIRDQINTIYTSEDDTKNEQPQSTAPRNVQSDTTYQQDINVNPYQRTQQPHRSIQNEDWRKYHTAWQEYYKKYYETYYAKHISEHKKRLEQQTNLKNSTSPEKAFGGSQSEADSSPSDADSAQLTKQQAMNELKQKLLGKVEKGAKKARKSRHFMPIAASLAVVIVFVFLQFNQVLIANVRAYVTPGQIDPQNIIVDPSISTEVGDDSRLIIPKINVDTPVFYDIGIDHNSQMSAMEDGVAHFPIPGANSRPGEVGNTVISGHSSNDVFAPGDFKFIFMQLDRLEEGDTIYANYEGTRYTYRVTKKEVVMPTEVDKLIYDTEGKPVMTLITCTPLGTDEKRLLITAEQIHPNPNDADPAPDDSGDSSEDATIPGQGRSSVLERAFRR